MNAGIPNSTIREVRIRNVMGIRDMRIEAGDIVHVRGKNGTGKTSIDRALRAALRGEVTADLLNKDAEDGEIIVLLDDGSEIRRHIGEKSKVSVRGPGGPVRAASRWLSERFDIAAIDPVDLLDADPKKRIEIVAEAVKAAVETKQLQEAVTPAGIEVIDSDGQVFHEMPDVNHQLIRRENCSVVEEIRLLIKDVEKWRTQTGRVKREGEASVKRLESSLPQGNIEKPAEIEEEMREQRKTLQALAADQAKAFVMLEQEEQDKHSQRLEEIQEGIGKIQQQIATLQEKLQDLHRERDTMVRSRKQEREAARQKIEKEYAEYRSEVEDKLEILTERHGVARERANTLSIIETEKENVVKTSMHWEDLQTSRDNLRKVMASIIAGLDIPGVEIEDDILYEGVPWASLNTGARMSLAARIAMLRGGSIIVVDRIESLDTESLEGLVTACIEQGIQLWTLGVSDEPALSTESENYDKPF